ncbi:Uncharacterised protein [Mycobacteroides abscessus subsp. massiliense]|nr:Uncharacterised protein [Mycobacteroides abscessus subsp. massiliense]
MQNTGDIYLGRLAWRWEIKTTPIDDGYSVSFDRAIRALRSCLRDARSVRLDELCIGC